MAGASRRAVSYTHLDVYKRQELPSTKSPLKSPERLIGFIISVSYTHLNSGYFDQVMDAAKAAGASGGTLIHARSLGSKEAEKYLGITMQPEKELVLILAPQEKRHAIMERITAETGLNTEARGSCFSLPVNSVMGLEATIDNLDDI